MKLFVSAALLLALLLGLWTCRAEAQTVTQAVPAFSDIKSQSELDSAVAALDAALFDSYNRCDLEKFASFFSEDVEFYHDQGGVTLGRAALTDSVRMNCRSPGKRNLRVVVCEPSASAM